MWWGCSSPCWYPGLQCRGCQGPPGAMGWGEGNPREELGRGLSVVPKSLLGALGWGAECPSAQWDWVRGDPVSCWQYLDGSGRLWGLLLVAFLGPGVHTGVVPEVGESQYPPSVSLSRMAEEEPRQGGDPQGDAPCSGVLDVGGFPPSMEVELLVLYFESRRRSGGGPVQSWQRHGPHLTITFQDPRDAQRVLARSPHRLEGAELRVVPAPPWDPSRLLLGGLNSETPLELLEPHLGTLLGRPPGTFTLSQGPAGWGLLHLHDPLTPQELAVVEQQVQCWGPEGARIQLQRVPRTPQVLVRAAVPGLSHDLLELYFENRRSGGGSVSDVKVLPGRQAAIVTFQQLDVAERVLERQHQLQGMVLSVEPHYSFLGAPEEDEIPVPGETLSLGTANTPGTSTSPDTVPPVPAKLEQTEPAVPSPMPGELPDAITGGHKDTEGDEAVARRWQYPEQAATVLASAQDEALVLAQDAVLVPPAVAQEEMLELAALAQDEVLVAAEPGAVRYLQWHYQDLLGSIPEVSLVPLEGGDVAGFRVSGQPDRCQAAAEFLQSLLGTVGSQTVPLQFPGIARFLRDQGGHSLLCQLESRFQCIIQVDSGTWSPPDPQLELTDLLPSSCYRDAQHCPGDTSDIEEIKELLAALHPGDATDDATDDFTDSASDDDPWAGTEQDAGAEPLAVGSGDGAREPQWGMGDARLAEEEAQMLLAIQRSMDSSRCQEQEVAELARATALSLRSFQREQLALPSEEEEEEDDSRLRAALEASLEEAVPAADVARVTIFCSFERDVSAVPQALEQALEGQLRAQVVVSERLQALPASCLALLQRRHAVSLQLSHGTATLNGFAEYAAAAARDLRALLGQLPEPGLPDLGTSTARWVRWDPSGTAIPYPAEAVEQLERAWQHQQRRLDLVLAGRPLTIDLQRMEEFDIGSARAVAISRSQPPAHSDRHLLGLEVPGLEEEEVRLLSLSEDSEEFAATVCQFYQSLEEQHGRISIVRVQKLIHPLLYQQYQLKKGSVARECAPGTVVERVLFHGTTEGCSREICLHGFNRSFCGRNGTLYGLGVYFAVSAALSARDQFSPPSPDGSKFIFMAQVLTGDYVKGSPGLRAPPLRAQPGNCPPRRYHSVVNSSQRPSIFVIFNDTQAYPQYLITCRQLGEDARTHTDPL
ncbi:protein mono-ADP-ribosyltransferase PARP10 isoform X2 [Melanerpes formicivorus]|uniref:protein mono-ADP-ribosyltransferase PARP10 isoform X2 n=1 Tax=Melanerpes formicivorus TaxID=211600 RepID=UPI00358EC3C4